VDGAYGLSAARHGKRDGREVRGSEFTSRSFPREDATGAYGKGGGGFCHGWGIIHSVADKEHFSAIGLEIAHETAFVCGGEACTDVWQSMGGSRLWAVAGHDFAAEAEAGEFCKG
jgi:hypothetical protein